MASCIVGQPFASGPQKIVSGNPWSGMVPHGGLLLRLDRAASGAVYFGYSGNVTMTSGGHVLSGQIGANDGFQLVPGDSYVAPRSMLISGDFNIFLWADAACSGQARLYFSPIFGR